MLLLLDLDNTLIDRDVAFRKAVQCFLAENNLPIADAESIMAMDASGYTPRPMVAGMLTKKYPHVSSSIVVTLLKHGGSENVTLRDDTREALWIARASGWNCVIVSNGTTVQQEAKIRNSGLDSIVHGWAISEGVGCKKPAPEIFSAAAEVVGEPLLGAWMVGDSPHADIGGAVAAGMRSVWVSRGGQWSDPHIRPTWIAADTASAITAVIGASLPDAH